MKRLYLVLLITSLCFALYGCGASKGANKKASNIPAGMNEKSYELGVKALKLMDKYNDAEIGKEEVDERLDNIYDALEELDDELREKESKEKKADDYGLGESFYNGTIQTDLLQFNQALFNISDESTFKVADELRKDLGMKED